MRQEQSDPETGSNFCKALTAVFINERNPALRVATCRSTWAPRRQRLRLPESCNELGATGSGIDGSATVQIEWLHLAPLARTISLIYENGCSEAGMNTTATGTLTSSSGRIASRLLL